MTRAQLIALGMSPEAIRHRITRGRLWVISRGIYAVGASRLTHQGHWMAAVLGAGVGAALSHESAAVHAAFWKRESRGIEVSSPSRADRRRPGTLIHRRPSLCPADIMIRDGIPTTTVPRTIIDLAPRLSEGELERAISEATFLRLTTPAHLLSVLNGEPPRPGTAILRSTLTRHSFRLTDSELERIFIPIAVKAGLPVPLTRQYVNGHRADFHWPDLGLVVETDGGWHSDPIQQTRDRRRDQDHTVAGLTPLRFTHWQVARERLHVERTLRAVARRLRRVA